MKCRYKETAFILSFMFLSNYFFFLLNSSKLCASSLDETQTKASSKTGKPVSSVRLVSCKLGYSNRHSEIM